MSREKGGRQREIQMQTRQETGISLQVPGPRKSKRSKVKNKNRLANEMRLRVVFPELTRVPRAFWKRTIDDHAYK